MKRKEAICTLRRILMHKVLYLRDKCTRCNIIVFTIYTLLSMSIILDCEIVQTTSHVISPTRVRVPVMANKSAGEKETRR